MLKYPLKRSMLFLAAAFALSLHHQSYLPFREDVRSISIKNNNKIFQQSNAALPAGLEIAISKDMSKEDIKESIVRLMVYRAESQIKEIVQERQFEFYNPFSELTQLEKKLKNSYKKTSGLAKLLAPKKFVKVRNEFREIQNKILDRICADVANGSLEKLTNSVLSSYYKDAVGYGELKEIYSGFYELSLSYLEKSKDRGETEINAIEEKEELVKMLFEKESQYIKSVYSGS